tara:strand:+ start:542 stop:1393 length:852 start_codon:yes stop_codon:yes gene_type:complete
MKALLVGLGVMGKRHLEAMKKNNTIQQIKTVDISVSGADFKSIDDALREQYDIAVVAVPTTYHEEISNKILDNKIPILLEKPISLNEASANRIIKKAKENNVKVCIGQIERFNPAVVKLKEVLEKEKVISINLYRVGPNPTRILDVDVSLDLSVHDLDLVEFITGQKILASKKIINSTAKHVDYLIKTEDGVSAKLTNSWMYPFRKRMVSVVTEEKYFESDLIHKTVDEYNHVDNSTHKKKSIWVDNKDQLSEQLKYFIDYVKNDTIGSMCIAEEATRILSWV